MKPCANCGGTPGEPTRHYIGWTVTCDDCYDGTPAGSGPCAWGLFISDVLREWDEQQEEALS